ncbi:MAG TPA: TetR/AcrR family transcriptional regulator [Propionicimonas sp.]|nr:TetR/AcrR family transcriptional regulator [Propionicimonas sp.]
MSEYSLTMIFDVSRATPMAPDERRRAIVDATVGLLLDKGTDLTTKEIAQAAGVAEGTIFRAFETKDEVIHAAVCTALQPTPSLNEIAELSDDQTLELRVEALLHILIAEIHRTRSLLVILTHDQGRTPGEHGHRGLHPGGIHDGRERLLQATIDALSPYADQLRVPAPTAGRVLTALAFASSFPTPNELSPTPETMANVVLHGIAEGV